IYEVTGIRIPLAKKMLLSNRVRRRLRTTGIEGFDAYLRLLKSLKPNDPEWDAFLQEITTHETYLFRDEVQWDWFRKDYLGEIAAAARRGERKQELRIWSAAASTGDEAHTIAACIADGLPQCDQWKIQIVGTDIGIEAIEHAKAGVYGERAMRLVPEPMKRRLFETVAGQNLWKAKPKIKQWLSFRQHNLMDPMTERPFDLVFVKNVLIYFDRDSKQVVIKNLRKVLAQGGLLVAGAAEGISDLLDGMERIQPWLYRQTNLPIR
ncbi:MAG: methyltransferase domain-containing protein, partial [Planctomycetales bacterium]|nr:methyltransferase domain-containing protein [Planctomycetales bacterium]